jgi:hypothetical protein
MASVAVENAYASRPFRFEPSRKFLKPNQVLAHVFWWQYFEIFSL